MWKVSYLNYFFFLMFLIKEVLYKSSHSQMFFKIDLLKNSSNFTGKHLWQILFSIKLWNFVKMGLQHRCYLVKFHLFYRIPPTFVFIRKNKNKLDSIQGCKKLYYGGGGGGGGRFSKKFGHNHSPTKKNLAKMPKSSPLKIKIWIKILFWQCYFGHTTILYLSILSIEHYQSIFLFFWFSCRKSQSKQKLAKRITHFMNLNLPDIENNMFPQHDQKLFSLYDFSSIHVSVWC